MQQEQLCWVWFFQTLILMDWRSHSGCWDLCLGQGAVRQWDSWIKRPTSDSVFESSTVLSSKSYKWSPITLSLISHTVREILICSHKPQSSGTYLYSTESNCRTELSVSTNNFLLILITQHLVVLCQTAFPMSISQTDLQKRWASMNSPFVVGEDWTAKMKLYLLSSEVYWLLGKK